MRIRSAILEDLPRLLDLGEMLHKESPRWSRMTFSRERAESTLRLLLTDPNGVIFVAERDGVVVGGIAGVAEQHWCSYDFIAHEMTLFMMTEARGGMAAPRLICALRAWGKLRKAIWLNAGTSTGLDPERTAGLYERLGFTRCAIGLEYDYGN